MPAALLKNNERCCRHFSFLGVEMDEWKREFILDVEEAIEATDNKIIRASVIVDHGMRALNRLGHQKFDELSPLCWQVWDSGMSENTRPNQMQAHVNLGHVIVCYLRDHATCLKEMGT